MARNRQRVRVQVAAGSRGFRRLRRQIRSLRTAAVDFDDPAAEARHYALARPVLQATIASRANSLDDLATKTEALIWAAGGLDFGLEDTLEHRVIASILGDLVALTEPEV